MTAYLYTFVQSPV